jgi:hypothetical protein
VACLLSSSSLPSLCQPPPPTCPSRIYSLSSRPSPSFLSAKYLSAELLKGINSLSLRTLLPPIALLPIRLVWAMAGVTTSTTTPPHAIGMAGIAANQLVCHARRHVGRMAILNAKIPLWVPQWHQLHRRQWLCILFLQIALLPIQLVWAMAGVTTSATTPPHAIGMVGIAANQLVCHARRHVGRMAILNAKIPLG